MRDFKESARSEDFPSTLNNLISFWERYDCNDVELVNWKQLDDLLLEDILDFPRIRLVADNQKYSKGYKGFLRYNVSSFADLSPTINFTVMSDALNDGCTLVIDRCESFFPKIKAVVNELEDIFSCKVTANLYASPCQSSSFGRHYDDHDVLAIQIYGEKKWEIHKPTLKDPLPHQKSFYFRRPSGQPDRTITTKRNNVLYIPRGYWHNVFAEECPSLHVSFIIIRPRRLDVAKILINSLSEDPYFRESVPYNVTESDTMVFADKINELLLSEDLVSWFEIANKNSHISDKRYVSEIMSKVDNSD